MKSTHKTLLSVTMWSLENEPEAWEIDKYHAKNSRLGIEVWLANQFYGTRINADGIEMGGVTFGSSLWTPSWRRSVIAAVEKISERKLIDKAGGQT